MRTDGERGAGFSAGVATARRWLLLHRPGWALAVGVGVFAVPVVLDFIPGFSTTIGSFTAEHDLVVSLSEHVAAAVTIGGVGYYWLFGHKRQKALRSYRHKLRDDPRKLVDWYGSEPQLRSPVARAHVEVGAKPPPNGLSKKLRGRARAVLDSRGAQTLRLRQRACQRLGDEITQSSSPAVAIVKGRAGTGRTRFLVELVDYLAGKGLVPIPLLIQHGGSFDLEEKAREKFFRNIEPATSSGEQVDAIWHFVCQTRGIVVLVDGLDKELFEELESDERKQAASAIGELQRNQIHLVLATTLDRDLEFNVERTLGLDRVPSLLHEDLDRFTCREAREYLQRALPRPLSNYAESALGKRDDQDDESLVDPFFLELLVRLTQVDLVNPSKHPDTPAQSDEWRRWLLEHYLDAVQRDKFNDTYEQRVSELDKSSQRTRGEEAYRAAQAVAELLEVEQDLTVARKKLKDFDPAALLDARQLNLLRVGQHRVSFSSDELGAYLFAATQDGPRHLLGIVQHIADGEVASLRHQRFALMALSFWQLEHPGAEGCRAFDRLLRLLERRGPVRPRLAAAALRILNGSKALSPYRARVAKIVGDSVDVLAGTEAASMIRPDPNGPVRLVRALSNWRDPQTYELLWRLGCSRKLEVEWQAVRALAAVADAPALERQISGVLAAAERTDKKLLSDESNALGNELASLAWLLPALRPAGRTGDDWAQKQWTLLKGICLDPRLAALRGEMAVAQGLKLAALMKRETGVGEIEELLLRTPPLRFWHARIVLVHALIAHTWRTKEHTRCSRLLGKLYSAEEHPLVKRAIALGVRALGAADARDGDETLRMYEYLWGHEADAVTWVEQRKWEISRLAADVVLLSNMTYELWKREYADGGGTKTGGRAASQLTAARPVMGPKREAEQCAGATVLPPCMTDSSKRLAILDSGSSDEPCRCPLCACGDPYAVLGTWARFSEAFCSEQARLVALHGPPSWVGLTRSWHRERKSKLEEYWRFQAQRVAAWHESEDRAGAAGRRRTTGWTSRGMLDAELLPIVALWKAAKELAATTTDR